MVEIQPGWNMFYDIPEEESPVLDMLTING